MDDDTREQNARKLADEAARAEAHEAGAFAAEAVRRDYGEDFIGARDPAQHAYDEVLDRRLRRVSRFF